VKARDEFRIQPRIIAEVAKSEIDQVHAGDCGRPCELKRAFDGRGSLRRSLRTGQHARGLND
jgi:hypothetical protein